MILGNGEVLCDGGRGDDHAYEEDKDDANVSHVCFSKQKTPGLSRAEKVTKN